WNWYWETLPPTARQKSWADEFFTNKDGDPKFLRAISKFRDWPESNLPEVAFVGRSNTGKSTLLNTLVNRPVKVLAHTSKTPGRTKTMNIYGVGAASDNGVRIKEGRGGEHDRIMGRGGLVIVDLPGYGEGSFAEWGTEILKYLVGRRQLRRTFVLIDPLHGLKDNDRAFLSRLRLDGVSHQIILPKMDRVFIPKSSLNVESLGKKAKSKGSIEELHYIMKSLRQEIQPKRGSGALGEILACSSQVGVQGRRLGIDSVRYAMLQAAGL
ncbi:GTP-binding protein engB, partial [Zopfia rhizophila CBS 207.26]